MADRLLLYISAASDLRAEREVLGRAVTEVPVSLAWRVVHSPGGDEPVDVDAVSRADVHLLLLGGDIRAPVGLEWRYALLAGRKPVPFLKQDALRTPAGEHFLRFVRQRAAWRPFRDPADLRRQFLALLAGHVIDRAIKAEERTIHNANIVALDKPDLLARSRRTGIHLLQQGIDLFGRQRSGLSPPTDEPSHLGSLLDHLQGFVSERRFQLDQDIPREKFSPGRTSLSILDLDHIFRGNQDLPKSLGEPHLTCALKETGLHATLKPRIGMDDVPVLIAHHLLSAEHPASYRPGNAGPVQPHHATK